MSTDCNAMVEHLILIPADQNQRLEYVAQSRWLLDPDIQVSDLIIEAVRIHIGRIDGPPNVGREGQPKRAGVLFDYLFGGDHEAAFVRISEGVIAALDNADELLGDASILVGAKRYARAEFLVATAQEELGKAFILLDMCRIDSARAQYVLRNLCRSFYSHVLKNVYFDLSANSYAGVQELSEVQHYFRLKAQEWWPAPMESGEPDMPHDTVLLREANLYVDVDNYSDNWMAPSDELQALKYEPLMVSPLDMARKALGQFRTTQKANLLDPDSLAIFNKSMKNKLINERTSMKELDAIYDMVEKQLQKAVDISPNEFRKSVLCNWPMYWVRR